VANFAKVERSGACQLVDSIVQVTHMSGYIISAPPSSGVGRLFVSLFCVRPESLIDLLCTQLYIIPYM
jgi:hypothetical protein